MQIEKLKRYVMTMMYNDDDVVRYVYTCRSYYLYY